MTWMKRCAAATTAMITLLSASAVALTTNQRCLTSRLAAVGRLATCELRAHGRAVVNGTSVDVSDCLARFSSKWAAIDGRGPCEPAVASGVVADEVDRFVQAIMALLNPPPPKIIFTTRETLTALENPGIGFFYYPSRGDEICTNLARRNPAFAGKVFVAALCGREPDVAGNAMLGIRERSNDSPGGYLRTDGAWIADDMDDLLDGTIEVPISYDQYGELLPDIAVNDVIPVWTGCAGTGDSLGLDVQCSVGGPSWSGVVGVAGQVGWPDRTPRGWRAESTRVDEIATSTASSSSGYCRD